MVNYLFLKEFGGFLFESPGDVVVNISSGSIQDFKWMY